jgi:hypothetical protein
MSKLRSLKRLWDAKGSIAKYSAVGGLTAGAVSFSQADSVYAGYKAESGAKRGALIAGLGAAALALSKPSTRAAVVFRRFKGKIIPIRPKKAAAAAKATAPKESTALTVKRNTFDV